MSENIETAILKIVANSDNDNGYNWHSIAIRLSNMDLVERPDMMTVLHKLTDEGLLTFDAEKQGWQITDAGIAEISKIDDQSGT